MDNRVFFKQLCRPSQTPHLTMSRNYFPFKQNNTKIAVYGNTTEEAAQNANLRVDIKAPTKDYPSMSMAIEKYINSLKE